MKAHQKLEPWLAARIADAKVNLFPNSQVTACKELPGGALEVGLSTGDALTVDQVILATGYKVDVGQIPLLAKGNILARLEVRNGFPTLDEHFQSSIPGLFFTSMCATQDFGPFFAFTVSVRASAELIGASRRDSARSMFPTSRSLNDQFTLGVGNVNAFPGRHTFLM